MMRRLHNGQGRFRTDLRWLAILLCFLCAASNVIGRAADDVASFLDRHELYELLALHLEQQLDATDGRSSDENDEVVLRLARVYALLLEREGDETKRLELEERSRELLKRAPSGSAGELRLALLRAAYARCEEIAERHRLRLAAAGEVARARSELATAIPELQRLVSHYNSMIRSINGRLARASGAEATVNYDRLARTERMRGSAQFLLGWSLYYRAWLSRDADEEFEADARVAEAQFAEILMADSPRPQPTDISQDLRSFEPMARSIVGMALCRSLTSTSATTALQWLDLLDDEAAFAAVRSEAPGWRLVILLEQGGYRDALALLTGYVESGGNLPTVWLRLAAVNAIEAKSNELAARDLLQLALAQLAAGNQLQQILSLAEQYGADRLGSDGFAVRYINGLISYREARDQEREDGTDQARLSALYDAAIAALEGALREGDAQRYPDAAAACRRLLGWALFYNGDYIRAREAFERAAEHSRGEAAAESLWMAIVCLDRLVEAGGSASLSAEREALVNRFLERYPSNQHAATLLVHRAAESGVLTDDEIRRLLTIPPGHDAYFAARLRVSEALYHRFRDTPASDSEARAQAGESFLGVAAPLLAASRFGDKAEEEERGRILVHLRRLLEVSLSPAVARLDVAQHALGAAEEMTDGESATRYRDELDYRRLQERLLSNDRGRAADLATALWERDPLSIWSRLANRSMLHWARDQWKESGQDLQLLEMVVQYGGRILREFEAEPAAIRRAGVLTYFVATAEASFELWHVYDHEGEAPRALFVYQMLLSQHPRQAAFLRPAAILASDPSISEYDFAAECWRKLSAGSETGSGAWFEARLGLISALEQLDPERALEIMDQHRNLHPNYGPEPWRNHFRRLDERLRAYNRDGGTGRDGRYGRGRG